MTIRVNPEQVSIVLPEDYEVQEALRWVNRAAKHNDVPKEKLRACIAVIELYGRIRPLWDAWK